MSDSSYIEKIKTFKTLISTSFEFTDEMFQLVVDCLNKSRKTIGDIDIEHFKIEINEQLDLPAISINNMIVAIYQSKLVNNVITLKKLN